MPTYIRPRRVIIETGGGGGGLVLIAAGIAAAAAVATFVLAHLLLLAGCAVVFVTVMGGVIAWMRWLASPRRLQEHRTVQRAALPAPRPARAIPASRPRAIEARRTVADQSHEVNQAAVRRV